MTVIIGGTGTANGITSFSSPATFGGTLATASRGISSASVPAGSIIQVQQTVKTDTWSTSSGSWSDITGLGVTITPTLATSKILIRCSVTMGTPGAGNISGCRLTRNGSTFIIGDANGSENRASWAFFANADANQAVGSSFSYLDSPATTSALTYQIQTGQLNTTISSTVYVNRHSNVGNAYNLRSVSSIIVMEIAQ